MPETPDPHRQRWWPSDPSLFTDTAVCPACFRALSTTVCSNCGLDVGVAEAAELLRAGTAVAAAENARQQLLTRMRNAQEHRLRAERQAEEARVDSYAFAAAPFAAAPFAPAPPPVPSAPVPSLSSTQPAPAGFGIPSAGMPPAGMAPAPARPRRSSIQILMLTVGIVLVSIMAIFFVLLAYVIASLEVRSVLTAIASGAVFGVAVLLSRRRLQGTAEGITALAVVLLLLDLWIIRANGLFGSGDLDGWLYTGIATGCLTALLALGARVLPLRTLSLAAVLLAPVSVFALVEGILSDLDAWTRAWAALTVVGLASLAWTRIRRAAERTILRVAGMLATVFAGLCAFGSSPDLAAGATIAFTVVCGVWLCTLAVAAVPVTSDGGSADRALPVRLDAWRALAAVGLGLAACGAGLSLLLRSGVEDAVFWLPASVVALAALAIAGLSRIPALAPQVPALRLAAVLPLCVATLASAPAAVYTLALSAWGAMTTPFSLAAFGSPERTLVPLEFDDGPLALLVVGALALAAVAALGFSRRAAWMPAALGGLGLVGTGAVLGQPVPSSLGLGILATALLVAVATLRSGSARVALCGVFALAVLVFSTIGLTSTVTFPVTAIATLVLLGAARQVIVRALPPATAAGLTTVASGAAAIALVFSARMVPTWFDAVTGAATPAAVPALWMTVAALLVGSGVPFAVGILGRAELAALAVVSVFAAGWGVVELVAADSAGALLVALGSAALAGLVWQFRARVASWPERFVTAAITPAAAIGAIGVAWDELGDLPPGFFDPDAISVVLAATIVVLAACAPVLFRHKHGRSGTHPARIAWDGALAVAAVVVLLAVAARPDPGWVALLLLAVSTLLVASGNGGILSGTAPRRHVAWLGLPLAVAGLWLGLARAGATVIELYTLPVAGLLLAILGLVVIRRPASGALVEPGRTALLAAALAVGLGPSAVAATGDGPLRASLVLLVAAVLVVGGALTGPAMRGVLVGPASWLAGAGAAVLTGLGRAVLHPDGAQIPFEVWSAGAAIILLMAGLFWYENDRLPDWFATAAVGASVVVLTLPTIAAVLSPGLDAWRAMLVLVVTCGVVVVGSARDEFSPTLRWVSIACGAVLAGALLVTVTADPFELATVPLALALVAGGSVRLARGAGRRSWPELGPGLALLLLPSLAADLGFGDELWRVVALGVVALVVLAAGLALKLQAPTLIGAVVVVLHALAQLWPWISGLYGSMPWWLWAGVGGVILIVLAATYEARIRDVRAVARGVSSLR